MSQKGVRTRARGGRSITSEELAKVRHSFIFSPVISFKEPKTFFDNSDHGRYWEAFGVDGLEVSVWTEGVLAEAVVALTIDDCVRTTAKDLKARDKERGREITEAKYLGRMSRYIVGLVGEALRQRRRDGAFENHSELLSSSARFDEVCLPLIKLARGRLRESMSRRREELDEVQPEYNLARDNAEFGRLTARLFEEMDSAD